MTRRDGGVFRDGDPGGAADKNDSGRMIDEDDSGQEVDNDDSGGAADGGETGACTRGRRILTDEVSNGRDLGGTPLAGGGTVACGKLYRGATLAGLTARGCEEFARLGIRTVVDLRVESEIVSSPDAACVQESVAIVLAPLPIPYNVSPEDYIADLDAIDSVAAAFTALGNEAAYPVFFHCTHGRDRSGVLAAVILLALGATREAVMAEYQLSLEAGIGAYPDSLEAVLDEIDRRGGVEAYLAAAGVSSDQIATLRAQATAR